MRTVLFIIFLSTVGVGFLCRAADRKIKKFVRSSRNGMNFWKRIPKPFPTACRPFDMSSHLNQVEYQFNIHLSIIATTVAVTAIAINQDALIDHTGNGHYRNSNMVLQCRCSAPRMHSHIRMLP